MNSYVGPRIPDFDGDDEIPDLVPYNNNREDIVDELPG